MPTNFYLHLISSTAHQSRTKSDCLDSTEFNVWGLHKSLADLMSSSWNKGIQVERVRYILYVSKDFFKQCEFLVVAISELKDEMKCDVM